MTHIKEKTVLKMLYGVLGTPLINTAKAKAKLAKRITPSSSWDFTFLK